MRVVLLVCQNIGVLLLFLLARAIAGELKSQITYNQESVYPNGTVVNYQARRVTWQCNANDRTMMYSVGPNRWTVAVCSPPTISYITTAISVSVRDPSTTTIRFCTTASPTDSAQNATIPSNAGTSRRLMGSIMGNLAVGGKILPSNRTAHQYIPVNVGTRPFRHFMTSPNVDDETKQKWLNQIAHHPRSHSPTWVPEIKPSVDRIEDTWKHVLDGTRRILGFFDSIADAFSSIGGGIDCVGIVVSWCADSGGSDDTTRAMIDNAMIAVAQTTKYWMGNVSQIVTAQGIVNTGFQDQINAVIKQQRIQEELTDSITQTQDLIVGEVTATNARIQQLGQTLMSNFTTALSLIGEYTEANIQRLQDSILEFNQQNIDFIVRVQNAAALANTQLNRRILDLGDIISQIQLTIYRSIAGTNEQVDRRTRIQYFKAQSKWTAAGRKAFVNPNRPGIPPVPLLQQTVEQLTSFIDIDLINYKSTVEVGAETVSYAHQYSVSFWCNTPVLMETVPTTMNYDQLMKLAGPTGCVSNATARGVDPVYECRCWWTITHMQCKSTTFDWNQINDRDGQDAYLLKSAFCDDNTEPAPGIYHQTSYDSLNTFLPVLENIACQSHSDLSTKPQFQVRHKRSGVATFDVVHEDSVCNFDFYANFITSTVNSSITATVNLPKVIFVNYKLAYTLMTTERSRSEKLTYGELPNGLTTKYIPFVTTLDTGVTAQCVDTSVTTLTDDTNIIYQLTAGPVVGKVETTVYDRQPDCTSIPGTCQCIGCTILDHTSITTTIDVDISNSGEAFPDGALLVSEIVPASKGGMTFLVDTPDESVSISPDAGSRKYKGNYIQRDIPVGYNLATEAINPLPPTLPEWQERNPGALFDHDATASHGYWEHPMSQEACIEIPGLPMNRGCRVLKNYRPHPETDMRGSGKLILYPIGGWVYTVTDDIPDGTLSTSVAEGCPNIRVGADTGSGAYIYVSNPWAQKLYVMIEKVINDPSMCTSLGNFGDEENAIGPYQEVTVYIPINCGNITVQVQQINRVTGTRIDCGPPVSTYISAATQTKLTPSGLTANQTTELVQSEVTKQIGEGLYATYLVNLETSYNMFKIQNPQTNFTMDEFEAIFINSSAGQYLEDLKARSQNIIISVSPDFIAQINQTKQEQNGLKAQIQAQDLVIAQLTVQLAKAVTDYNNLVANLTDITAQAQAAWDAAAVAYQADLDYLKSKSSGGCDWICTIKQMLLDALGLCLMLGFAYLVYILVMRVIRSRKSQSPSSGENSTSVSGQTGISSRRSNNNDTEMQPLVLAPTVDA